MSNFYIQAFSVKLGLIENFPTAVHHQSRLGAMLGKKGNNEIIY